MSIHCASAVNLTLSEDRVFEARELTSNLSAVVETLLIKYADREREARQAGRLRVEEAATAWSRRIVVPRVRRSPLGGFVAFAGRIPRTPVFSIEGIDVNLQPREIVSRADDGEGVVDALDDLLTRSWV